MTRMGALSGKLACAILFAAMAATACTKPRLFTTNPHPTPAPSASTPAARNLAPQATPAASDGSDTAFFGADADPQTIWNSGTWAPQWYFLALDGPHVVDRIDLLMAQTPAGKTTHEIWLADATFRLHQRLEDIYTSDGQLLTVPVQPAQAITRVLIRTLDSPSYVAWREVRVFGRPTETVQPLRPSPQLRPFLPPGLEMPVQIVDAGDGTGRLFVLEQKGRVRVVTRDGTLQPTPFLDISDRVICCRERGLLGIAFPADFADKGHFYVSYTASGDGDRGPGDLVVARFRLSADGSAADPASEDVVLVIPQPHEMHNGGRIAFGPRDGYLYIGAGDGGPASDPGNRSQDPSHLLGKMLRLDVQSGVLPYAVPPDNPFVQTPGHRPEIWALGLRNPWGFAFDRASGDLYIPDAGDNEWEEVNLQSGASPGGENYGWPLLEGLHCTTSANCSLAGLAMPLVEHHHAEACAVVGGAVRRGALVYADFCSGRIWELQREGDVWRPRLLVQAKFPVSAIGQDERGTVYVLDYASGAILELADAPN